MGEIKETIKLDGKGVVHLANDTIQFGFFDTGKLTLGNYLVIEPKGSFTTGELYLDKKGKKRKKGTHYCHCCSKTVAFDRPC